VPPGALQVLGLEVGLCQVLGCNMGDELVTGRPVECVRWQRLLIAEDQARIEWLAVVDFW